jgi:beta-phosphoglucomutase-like phosphatase (HAD superfamily)
MIKLIIFDLDGVLVEAKSIHYDALNKALGNLYAIEWNEHLSVYDGLKTQQKLDMLTIRKGLSIDRHKEIWELKQKYTLESLKNLT